MSSGSQPTDDAPRGYLSEQSKRQFTIVAGILGAVCFLAQTILPMVLMFAIMMPMMFSQEIRTFELDHAAPWRGEFWVVEQATELNLRDVEHSTTTYALARVDVEDLSDAGPAVPLGVGEIASSPELLPIGDRLWVIGADAISYYEAGSLTRLVGGARPRQASQPFAYGGRPAVVSLGVSPTLAMLQVENGRADWVSQELRLGLPPAAGSLDALRAVEAGGQLYLFAEVCTKEPEQCSLTYRTLDNEKWQPLLDDACSCANWRALAVGERPAVAFVERQGQSARQLVVVTVTASGPDTERIDLQKGVLGFDAGRVFAIDDRLLLVSQGMPRGLRLIEVAAGRVTRTVKRPGQFPFGPNMMVFMTIPQLLPVVLSLLLALVLTIQMRRHRVQDYVLPGEQRRFASLWQRALAQLVDLVPIMAGFAVPAAAMWRMFSDPESLLEKGPMFPLWFFAFFAAAFLYSLLVFVAYSYFEGRVGKTPGKWLLGIRVLGTDLHPCGFGRALLRNILTFVDGFFNFLVGALLVALTENWQRLGDLAARTIVVVDQKPS